MSNELTHQGTCTRIHYQTHKEDNITDIVDKENCHFQMCWHQAKVFIAQSTELNETRRSDWENVLKNNLTKYKQNNREREKAVLTETHLKFRSQSRQNNFRPSSS